MIQSRIHSFPSEIGFLFILLFGIIFLLIVDPRQDSERLAMWYSYSATSRRPSTSWLLSSNTNYSLSQHRPLIFHSSSLPLTHEEIKGSEYYKQPPSAADMQLDKVEGILAGARASIREATANTDRSSKLDDPDYIPHGDIYRNPNAFHWSYLLMEKHFKVFVYEEGEPPIFHYGLCKDIYSTEGFFLNFMELDTRFRTRDPGEAHVYFLPFSVVMILEHLFDPVIRDKAVLQRVLVDYVHIISSKYPYWNRSFGTDHFMLSCHDWGPRATWYVPQLYFNAIRVLCNANTSEHFNPNKDASFPEINIRTGDIQNLTESSHLKEERPILAFFAGGLHGQIRPALFHHWKEKDDTLLVYETLPRGMSYSEMMTKSKFCLCPSGHEVASPRIPEAIYADCIPVLISENYVLPFSDVLNWDSFSVKVSVQDIPDLKRILAGIPEKEYARMQNNVRQVKRHFAVNDPPRRYDVFNMIIHSIWLRRLNLRVGLR
ncbi:hypothetical protein SAY87_007536 [Trapa incisa]|uniref:Exostosin GT47 domain-containing protein n=1 Tax=Trapa incisa TaxID=236973 RepID=A0AAN7KEL2_9MYRT|nr:hypothetical protein SAY87_007536 [Trapa incisa]